jgi:hypothetical protein
MKAGQEGYRDLMQSGDLSRVWISADSGELVRADAIIGLQCAGGSADARCSDGRLVRLAGSGCPADFHVQLLAELDHAAAQDRWILIISPEASRGGMSWTQCRVEDLPQPDENGLRR